MQLPVLRQILLRIKSKSPALFQKIQIGALILAVLVSGLNWCISKHYIKIENPEALIAMLNTVGGALFGLFGCATLTTTNPDLMDEKAKQAVIEKEGCS